MELDDLIMFNHLSHSLNFGDTAEAFHMSPSNLTWRIKNLEKELGTQLFERDTRNVSLSPDGALFATFATKTVSDWEQIKNTFQDPSRPLQGKVRLFASVSGTYTFMPKLLKKIREKHPEIDVTLQSGPIQNGIDRLANNESDIAIMPIPENPSSLLEYRALAAIPLVAVAAKSHPTCWETDTLILPQKGPSRDIIDKWTLQNKRQRNPKKTCKEFESILTLAAAGYGIGFVPKVVLNQSSISDDVKTLKLTPPLPSLNVGMITTKKKADIKRISAILNLI